MKKFISLSVLLCLLMSMGVNASATRMRETEKKLNAQKSEESAEKDWGNINYVDNLPGPDFSGYTYGGEEIEIPNYNNYKSVYDLPKHKFDEMMHFFSVYKQLEEKETVVNELAGPEEAKRIIEDAIHHYNEVYGSRPREN